MTDPVRGEETSRPASIDWECLARSELHPVRVGILDLLHLDGGRTLSATEIAYEMRLPVTNVRYHVKALLANDALRPAAQLLSPGTLERFYCLRGHSGADLFCRPPFHADEFELVDRTLSLYRKKPRLPST